MTRAVCTSRAIQDRDVEAAVVAVRNKVNGVKGALSSFVGKMEQGPLTWLGGRLPRIMKERTNELKCPPVPPAGLACWTASQPQSAISRR